MKKILFICVENAGRSQMAEAFAKKYSKREMIFSSAGIKPAKKINPVVVSVMKEKNIDISKKKPKALTNEMTKTANLIITMGCGANDICVREFSTQTIDWKLEDPKGKHIDKVREIRDEIEQRVTQLLVHE